MAAFNRHGRKYGWLRIYKNPLSNSYRVDLGVPAKPGSERTAHAYVGTAVRKVSKRGAVSFEGALTSINSDDLRSDFAKANRAIGNSKVALLQLREVPFENARQKIQRLKAIFIVAAGRYSIEARYGTGEIIVIGTLITHYPQEAVRKRNTAPHSRGAQRPK